MTLSCTAQLPERLAKGFRLHPVLGLSCSSFSGHVTLQKFNRLWYVKWSGDELNDTLCQDAIVTQIVCPQRGIS